jgi:L-ribulose-5-phosphate 3-epimerase
MNRRTFLASSAAFAALAPLGAMAQDAKKKAARPPARDAIELEPFKPSRTTPRPNKKALMFSTFRNPPGQTLSLREKFQMLKDAGFHGVEIQSAHDQKEVLAARDAAGLEVCGVTLGTHWNFPFSDPNPSAREKSVEGLKIALRDAKAYGAKSVLVVPAVVTKQVSYADAHKRSIEEIKKCVPLAEELGVAISIENVWNQFLLSPLEAVQYCDSFKSPMVRWHFDVGNVINTGYAEQWIRVLGPRIANVHVKEFSRKLRTAGERGPFGGFDVALLEGDSDWPSVMKAFDEINYTGYLITEQGWPRDLPAPEFLAHLSQKLDQILLA